MGLTKEHQYAACFEAEPVVMGPMTSEGFRRDPRRLGFTLARYKFVAKMLSGIKGPVIEIGCGDAFGSRVVAQEVKDLYLYDFDEAWTAEAIRCGADEFARGTKVLDLREHPEREFKSSAIYCLDVIEHVEPWWQTVFINNVAESLHDRGVFIVGTPSLESQKYASEISKAGHVGCFSADDLRAALLHRFHSVFSFGMNDETLHTGFGPMCQYLLAVAVGPK
jgi:methyltransferase family protein